MSKEEVKELFKRILEELEDDIKSIEYYNLRDFFIEEYLWELDSSELLEIYNNYQEYFGDEEYVYENDSYILNQVFDSPWEALSDFRYFDSSDKYFVRWPEAKTIDEIPIEDIEDELLVLVMTECLNENEDKQIIFNIDLIELYAEQ